MRLWAWFERLVSPGLGCCYRCNRPWKWNLPRIGVEPHSTQYTLSQGCFPLCEGCWAALTPDERLPFYIRLVNRWIRQVPENRDEYEEVRPLIYNAVMDGK